METSVVDPNTLDLDPDPGFWCNLDLDFLENFRILEKTQFS